MRFQFVLSVRFRAKRHAFDREVCLFFFPFCSVCKRFSGDHQLPKFLAVNGVQSVRRRGDFFLVLLCGKTVKSRRKIGNICVKTISVSFRYCARFLLWRKFHRWHMPFSPNTYVSTFQNWRNLQNNRKTSLGLFKAI